MNVIEAMREMRTAIARATRENRSYGGRRTRLLTADERAEAVSREDHLLELARRAIRKAA